MICLSLKNTITNYITQIFESPEIDLNHYHEPIGDLSTTIKRRRQETSTMLIFGSSCPCTLIKNTKLLGRIKNNKDHSKNFRELRS